MILALLGSTQPHEPHESHALVPSLTSVSTHQSLPLSSLSPCRPVIASLSFDCLCWR